MKTFTILSLSLAVFITACTGIKTAKAPEKAIVSGVAWFDQNNNEVNAHGTCIIKEGDLYYMFGEHKTDMTNAFTGFACYSSPDLINWKFENVALPRQADGLLGPDRVGERPKVMKCPATGEFVMYMHCDNLGYTDQHIGYATCATINGDYEFHGPILMDGQPIRRWDMGTFHDTDGKGYLLIHHGYIYALSEDFRSVDSIVVKNAPGGESPAIFKHDGTYYWMSSNLTSWERNDNSYLSAPTIAGPWTKKGFFAPEGTLTWNSQCSFVLPVYGETDTTYMYMGDRWSFPMQGSCASYVWQPITVSDGNMSIPEFHKGWKIDVQKGTWSSVDMDFETVPAKKITTTGDWEIDGKTFRSKEKDAVLKYTFKGKQVAVYATSNNTSGYGNLYITDAAGNKVISTKLDCYSKYEVNELKFLSPVLEEGEYTLTIEVMAFHSVWTDKSKTIFGSTDDYVTVTGIASF